MYIKTRNVRFKEEALEAYVIQDCVITFHLVSGTEISIDYGTKEAVEKALKNIDDIIESL